MLIMLHITRELLLQDSKWGGGTGAHAALLIVPWTTGTASHHCIGYYKRVIFFLSNIIKESTGLHRRAPLKIATRPHIMNSTNIISNNVNAVELTIMLITTSLSFMINVFNLYNKKNHHFRSDRCCHFEYNESESSASKSR